MSVYVIVCHNAYRLVLPVHEGAYSNIVYESSNSTCVFIIRRQLNTKNKFLIKPEPTILQISRHKAHITFSIFCETIDCTRLQSIVSCQRFNRPDLNINDNRNNITTCIKVGQTVSVNVIMLSMYVINILLLLETRCQLK